MINKYTEYNACAMATKFLSSLAGISSCMCLVEQETAFKNSQKQLEQQMEQCVVAINERSAMFFDVEASSLN